MRFCQTCGEKLNQQGQCPACAGAAKSAPPKRKKLLLIIGIAAMVIVVICAFLIGHLTAGPERTVVIKEEVHTHEDTNSDGICDDPHCVEPLPVEPHTCADGDGDGLCDDPDCKEEIPVPPHTCADADGSGLCDYPGCETEFPVEPVEDAVATLAAVGDIMAYDAQLEDALTDDGAYDFMPSFQAVRSYTESADLTVGNLELNLLGGPNYTGDPRSEAFFNAPESLASDLNRIGFDILQTANTYSIVNGIAGLQSTLNFLHQAGIDTVGTRTSEGEDGVIIREVNGIRMAFLAFTKGLNGMTLPTQYDYAVDLLYTDYNKAYETIDVATITERVEAAKAHEPDVIIAMCHWGSEYDQQISKTQVQIRDLMFKNGVDVILGSHSHIVGPMEEHQVKTADGEEKTCFVAYSLGNFISAMNEAGTQESVILNLEFTKDGETGLTTISDISYTPLYILDRDEEADVRFEILPIRNALSAGIFQAYETELNDAIENLRTNTNSNYDSGQ